MGARTERYTGVDATGSDGGSNRVLTIANLGLTSNDNFNVSVQGLDIALTTDYTVSHLSTNTTITFLNALFDSQYLIISYTEIFEAGDNPIYCTAADVFAFLQLGASADVNFNGQTDFSASTTPTLLTVEGWINESQDYIDQETMHAWRAVTVTKEQHHLEIPHYQLRDGSEIKLLHRNIKTLTSGTDLLEVWDGTQYLDYLANKTEGRNKDYWANEQMGFVFIKTYPSYLPRTFGVRVTYRFGDSTVPGDIKRACMLLTAIQFLSSEDRSVLLPEGTSNIPYQAKDEKWQKRIDEILDKRRELMVINT